MPPHRIDFSALTWESPLAGMRQKVVACGGKQVRLVEYAREMQPHWCEKGHYGLVLDGRFELEFPDGTVVYEAGDGVFIPDGPDHRHQGTVRSEKVTVVFVEDV